MTPPCGSRLRNCPKSFLTPALPMSQPSNNQFSDLSPQNYFCLILEITQYADTCFSRHSSTYHKLLSPVQLLP